MYDRYLISRCNAIEFIKDRYNEFPLEMPDVKQIAKGISESQFEGWKFIILDDGELVFADCLSECIRKDDVKSMAWPSETIIRGMLEKAK